MSNPAPPTPPPDSGSASLRRGPWRVLILDSSGDDPKWCICTVTIPSDIRPAVMDGTNGARYADWPEVCAWVRHQVGHPVSLVPVAAIVWRVGEPQP